MGEIHRIIARKIKEDIKDSISDLKTPYTLVDGYETLFVYNSDDIDEDTGEVLSMKYTFEVNTNGKITAKIDIPYDDIRSDSWEEDGAELIKLLHFKARYDDQWDFTFQNIDRGEVYYYYLKENGKEMVGKDPLHLRDVPTEYYDDFFLFLKKALADHWGCTVEEAERDNTLEIALEEFDESV